MKTQKISKSGFPLVTKDCVASLIQTLDGSEIGQKSNVPTPVIKKNTDIFSDVLHRMHF